MFVKENPDRKKKVLVSKKIAFGEKNYKYFIGYVYNGNKV